MNVDIISKLKKCTTCFWNTPPQLFRYDQD